MRVGCAPECAPVRHAERPRRASSMATRNTPGIRVRHSRTCKTTAGGSCNCDPSIEAWVFSKRDGKKIRKTFAGHGALAAAKGWRIDATKLVKDKRLRAPTGRTLRQEVDESLA